MSKSVFSTLLVILSLFITTCSCEPSVTGVYKRSSVVDPSKEKYYLAIKEEGSHVREKLLVDSKHNTAFYDVPAHRDIDESHVMTDFNTNLSVTRIPGKRVCYIRPRLSNGPSFKSLKTSMEKAASGEYKIKTGSRLLSSEWVIKGPADLSTLSKKVIDFCRGLPIIEIKEKEEDGVSIKGGAVNVKRNSGGGSGFPFPLCKNFIEYSAILSACPDVGNKIVNYDVKCKIPSKTCVYYTTCEAGVLKNTAGKYCNANHRLVSLICCDLTCPGSG